jgi:hypothetical protein
MQDRHGPIEQNFSLLHDVFHYGKFDSIVHVPPTFLALKSGWADVEFSDMGYVAL